MEIEIGDTGQIVEFPDGTPNETIEAALKEYIDSKPQEVAPPPVPTGVGDAGAFDPFGAALGPEVTDTGMGATREALTPSRETVKQTIETAAETIGGVGGAIVGAAGGTVVGGPGVGTTVGGITGGALGYAGGKEVGELITSSLGLRDRKTVIEELEEIPKDVYYGLKMEAGGRLLGAGARVGIKATRAIRDSIPAFSGKRLEQQAGRYLMAMTTEGPIYAANAKEAREIEKRIPGIRFTISQLTKDPKLVQMERSIEIKEPNLLLNQRAESSSTIQQQLDDLFPAGAGMDDTITAAQARQASIEAANKTAQRAIQAEMSNLSKGMNPQDSGRVIHAEMQGAKRVVKDRVTAEYDAIPNIQIDLDDMLPAFKNLATKPLEVGGGAFEQIKGNVPEVITNAIKVLGKQKTYGFQDLRGLRTILMRERRAIEASATPNFSKIERLNRAQNAVEHTINKIRNTRPEVANQFDKATELYKNYVKTYKQGTVADVTQAGRRGELTRIQNSNIADRFFNNLDTVDDFVKAAGGNENAKMAMKDFAAHDLLTKATNPTTGELIPSSFNRWMTNNQPKLKRLGIDGDFAGIKKAQELIIGAKALQDNFNKSVASKILGVDAQKAFAEAFTGKSGRQTAEVTRELLNVVKGDVRAEQGLKKALKDHILEQSRLQGIDLLNNPIISSSKMNQLMQRFEPAMKVLYTPKEFSALKDVQKAYQILDRNIRSPIASGSDTAEKLVSGMTLGSVGMIYGKWAPINFIIHMQGLFSKYSEEQVHGLITRAMFDPDFAKTLVTIAKRKAAPKLIDKMVDENMMRMGMYGYKKMMEDEPEEKFAVEGY